MNPHQLDLLGEPKARRTDPKTSHVAAVMAKESAKGQRGRIMEVLADYRIVMGGGCTADELDKYIGFRPTTAGRRLSELRDLGLVETTGEERLTRSGRPARVWRVVR